MNKGPAFFISLVVLVFFFSATQAQTRDDLEKKKKALLNEISSMQKELDATSKNKKLSLSQVKALQGKIASREKLINNYNGQINQLDAEISKTNTTIKTLGNNLNTLKANYARTIVYAYKHRNAYDKLLFILSAESFNDAFRRFLYLRRYSTYRRAQAEQITATQQEMSGKVVVLKTQKKSKTEMLAEQQQEKNKLQKEKVQKDKTVKELSGQEKKIKTDLAAKKKEQDKLNKQIQAAIKKEIAAAAKKASAATGSSSSSKTSSGTKSGSTKTTAEPTRTPEIIAMSNSFVANRGKFPWPVEQGVIIEQYGTHPHPVLKNVTTKNNGVDIKTTKGATVRSIFNGTVVNVLVNPGYHKAVLIRHGDYFTVYSNLESVNVKAGDKVSTKGAIGKAYTDTDENMTMVHLEVWQGTTLLNPESWLLDK